MKQVEKKSFLLIDEENGFLSSLTGHPLLKDLLSGYFIRLIRPSSSSHVQVQDPSSSEPAVAVLNLASLGGKVEECLASLGRIPKLVKILVCTDHSEGLKALGRRSGIIAAGSEEVIVETIRSSLKNLRLSEQLALQGRTVAQLRRRKRRLEKEIEDLLAVGEIVRSISSTLLIEEILKGILKGIRQVLTLDKVLLGLVNSETGEEEIKVAIGIVEQNSHDYRWKITEDDPVWKELKEEGRPLLLECKSSPEIPLLLSRIFKRKFIKAPMIVKGQIIGTIMGERAAGRLSKRELRLLQILVEYAGIAIENGRLYYEVITSEEELRKTQRQLVGAERLAVIGQLAVSINHEINNPLCNISLITQTLKAKLVEKMPETVPRLEGIEQNIERIRAVTQRVSQIKDAQATEYLPEQLMINLR